MSLSRRKLFGWLGAGAAVAAVPALVEPRDFNTADMTYVARYQHRTVGVAFAAQPSEELMRLLEEIKRQSEAMTGAALDRNLFAPSLTAPTGYPR